MMPSSNSPTATISTRFSRTRSFTSPPTPAFRKPTEPDAEAPELDPEEQLAKVIREHDLNQLFVAFTATPSQATLDLFGKPFDSYTEAEAIAEGYIVDVAASIITYKTLYNLHCHFVPPGGEGDSMFLDKPVADRNAVQTVSRLNRCHEGKRDVVVVDFTNNAAAILKAFQKYRKGTPFEPEEPDKDLCPKLYNDILAVGVFAQKDAADFVKLVANGTDAQVQFFVNALRTRFQAHIVNAEERKSFVYLLARYVKVFHFLSCFFSYAPELKAFATFAEYIGEQLIKIGSVSDLMKQIRQTEVIKAAVEYQGVTTSAGPVKLKPGHGKKGVGPPPKKVSVQDMITEIRNKFNITDEEALYIKEVTEEKAADPVIRTTVTAHREDRMFLESAYRSQVNAEIQDAYDGRGRYNELANLDYTREGGIFDIMAITVIDTNLAFTA